MVLLRSRQNSKQTDSKPEKAEPNIHDDPLSSSEEEDEANASGGELSDALGDTPKKTRLAGLTIDEKLAQNRDGKIKDFSFKSTSPSRKRTSEAMHDDDIKDDIFDFISRSSQRSSKRQSYGSRNSRRSESFRKTPSSSMVESFPPSSAPPCKLASESLSRKTDNTEEDEDEDKENRESGFKIPRDIETDLGFKQPPDISASSFSLPTSTARDFEIPDSDDDSPLSSPVSYASLDVSMKDDDDPQQTEYLCPMCKEPVEPGLLIAFQAQPRQRIRDQQVFCESHRKSSAEKEWAEKGYPTIDWEKFDERIQAHFDDLEKILVPDSASYYRNVLDTTMKSGQAKNFRLTLAGDGLETISCGYYGTRGSGKMLQAITSRFSRKLRRLAAEDRIIKQTGVVVYSQAVLVPELAVRLIKEDMGVTDESARQIMRESIDIGENLNFALNDNVPVPEETDDVRAQN